jgi:Ca2+-binding EF-hand superfamily protein
MSLLGNDIKQANFIDRLQKQFRNLDANQDGQLSQADADIHQSMTLAGARANLLEAWLRADANGDGYVTEAELKDQLLYASRSNTDANAPRAEERIAKNVRERMAADADRDGRVSLAEAYAATGAAGTDAAARNVSVTVSQMRELLAVADFSGALPFGALEALAIRVFTAADTNRDGGVSNDEATAFRQEKPSARGAPDPARCPPLPKASPDAKIVLLSANESDALSTTTIGSQDAVTGTGSIFVESGTDPLYVIVASYAPTIWRVTGAASRIERLVVSSSLSRPNASHRGEAPLSGVTGLAAERATFVPVNECLKFFTDASSSEAKRVSNYVRDEAGRDPVVTLAAYKVAGFELPSGKVRTNEGRQTGTLRTLLRTRGHELEEEISSYYPGGVVTIDPAAVVSPVPAATYEVLPSQAGLLQLVRNGTMTREGSKFLIHRKTRLPPGLYGAHAVRFVLLRGVPRPDGDPGHSCIVEEETGRPLSDRVKACQ